MDSRRNFPSFCLHSGCSLDLFFPGADLTNWRQVLVSADGDPHPLAPRQLDARARQPRLATVIRADHFSHTRKGAPLIAKEWLARYHATAGNLLGWKRAVLLGGGILAPCSRCCIAIWPCRADAVLATGLSWSPPGIVAPLLARPHL